VNRPGLAETPFPERMAFLADGFLADGFLAMAEPRAKQAATHRLFEASEDLNTSSDPGPIRAGDGPAGPGSRLLKWCF